MKFNLVKHNLFRENHDSADCFCKKFKDGEEMWEVKQHTEEPKNVYIPPVPIIPRDPSQSEQTWDEEEKGREMDRIFED